MLVRLHVSVRVSGVARLGIGLAIRPGFAEVRRYDRQVRDIHTPLQTQVVSGKCNLLQGFYLFPII
jgi:hypothetical protein